MTVALPSLAFLIVATLATCVGWWIGYSAAMERVGRSIRTHGSRRTAELLQAEGWLP